MPSVLLLTLASIHPRLGSLKKIEHEYSLCHDLDTTWAVRPLALSQYNGQKALVLEDPGGEFLHRLDQGPMEIKQFMRIAIALSTTRPVTQSVDDPQKPETLECPCRHRDRPCLSSLESLCSAL
jgi:hypothetical protein